MAKGRAMPKQRSGKITASWLILLALIAFFVQLVCLTFVWRNNDEQKSFIPEAENRAMGGSSGNTCTVYMAPSSVYGIKSMGIYTTKHLPRNSPIVDVPDGISLPVIDYYGYDDMDEPDKLKEARRMWRKLFDEYWWGRGVSEQLMLEGETVVDFKMTFGELPNHHCLLHVISLRNPKHAYNDALLNRTVDPGIGAFSYHMARELYVSREVQAGEELFLNYGHCGDNNLRAPDWSDNIVKTIHFQTAARLTRRTWNKLREFEPVDEKDEKKKEEQIKFFDDIVKRAKEQLADSSKNAASVFPGTYSKLRDIMTKGPSDYDKQIAMRLARQIGTTPRSVDWIVENGLCVDSMVAAPSKLPHAGQGAFAKFSMHRGEIIMPAPLLHIVDKEALRVYGRDANNSSLTTTQLLMNYCLGHGQSSLLLCPITGAMLVNHCSTRKRECGKDGPNAEFRWATSWDNKSDTWLEKTLEELAEEQERGLSMELVAIRDIREGEEIFIDYGVEWELAWDKHVANWKPPVADREFSAYISPTELNEMGGPLKLLVSGDLRKDLEHPNLFTRCIFWPTDFDEDDRWEHADPNWKDLDDATILKKYASNDGSEFTGDYEDQFDGSYWPCSVIRSDSEDDSTYTVRMGQSRFRHETAWYQQDLPRFIRHFPRGSIRYFNKPYTSDQHLLRAFRHHVGIPDDIFPKHWKNLEQ